MIGAETFFKFVLPIMAIPLPTFLAFWLIVLFFNRWKRVSHTIAIAGATLAFLLSMYEVLFLSPSPLLHLAEKATWPPDGVFTSSGGPFWFFTPWLPTGATTLNMGVYVDALTIIMLFFVSITVLGIFIYSTGYMHGDPKYSRFFAFISLFATGMYGLVIADNLLMLFIFWEVMGLCSYLLIGFWYHKPSAYRAAVKAFMTTRIGDVFLLLGLVYIYSLTGTLTYAGVFNVEVLEKLVETPAMLGSWPVFGLTAAELAGLLILAGTVGKSAQFPLHVWLPDAMEGPTPVSAMIHAATMVSAGVYLVIRAFPLLSAGWGEGGAFTAPMVAMGLIGAFTAFMASTIAVAQNDIKKVLAYSTISQLGYMIAALGVGAYVAAAFHLMTHAFFKALLFLGSGSVIIGSHHEQDMMQMGGLWKKMPITFVTFVIGGLALSGFPLITAGFWSKDEILAEAYHMGLMEGQWLGWVVYLLLTFGALLTAFYTARQICLTFLGEPRSHHAEHAHRPPFSMEGPLLVLAVFALFLGFVGVPEDFPWLGHLFGGNFIHHWLVPHGEEIIFNPTPAIFSIVIAVGGLVLGWWVYGRKPLAAGDADPLQVRLGGMHELLKNKYYVDEFYNRFIIQPVLRAGTWVYENVDRFLIDGALHGLATGGVFTGRGFRAFDRVAINESVDKAADGTGRLSTWSRKVFQSGMIQEYLFITIVVVFLSMLVYAPSVYLWVANLFSFFRR